MLVKLSCNYCGSELLLPIMVGGMYPNVESICKKCESGLLLVKEIQQELDTQRVILDTVDRLSANGEGHAQLNDVLNEVGTILGEAEINAIRRNDSRGGNEILTSFHNRISTVVVIVQLMNEIADNERVLNVSTLIDKFKTRSNQIREHLKDVEANLGVKRGEKLSDGYPEDNPSNLGPMTIVLRNIMGSDGEHVIFNRGLIQQMGLVEAISPTEFCLTDRANPFIDLPCMKSELLLLDEPELISSNPKLPKYLKEDTSIAILDALFESMPDEKDWAMHILEIIEMASISYEQGWDSNQYAQLEASTCANGLCHPRWSTHDGKTLFEKYQNRAKRQRKRSPDDHAADRLEKFINGSLGGLLSRMKELGLIIPVRLGNTKNFKITPFGEHVLHQFMSKELVV
jgi:hypothetical protein